MEGANALATAYLGQASTQLGAVSLVAPSGGTAAPILALLTSGLTAGGEADVAPRVGQTDGAPRLDGDEIR